MDTLVSNKNTTLIKDISLFKSRLKQESNTRLILKSTIITCSVMLCFLIMGLIFAQQNIFLISALLSLFGQHLVAYNVVNLTIYILSGGIIGLLISYITARYVNRKRNYESIPDNYIIDKTFESIIIPLVFSIRDLCAKNTEFTNENCENYKTGIITLITKYFGYDEVASKDLVEHYFQMDIKELFQKLNELNFSFEISMDDKKVKRDISFLRKHFKDYYRLITNNSGDYSPSFLLSKTQAELIKKEEKNVILLLSNSGKKLISKQ